MHEMNRNVGFARQGQYVVVEIGRACRHDRDLLGRRPARQQGAHPAESLDRLVLRVGAGVQPRLGDLRNFGADLDLDLAQPIWNMPRPGDPDDRKGFRELSEQWTPARRHLAVAVDLHRPQRGFRVGDALAGELNQFNRPLH